MNSFDWRFFLLAFGGTAGMVGIGVGLAESSTLIVVSAILLALFSVGTGFTLKHKIKQQEKEGRA
ncbi:YlaF family protein [Evansella sp. LMS18]|uniref:DUF5325 family protein n=1 Tax=Evansella sp. LMS18 TaxID=2924033 RepID=UPI0020D166F0|nr:DUF5325 family protein [Evansella sp. LMS18]UTR11016.1 YlaF family protein [Evansella sp. LMS18]